MFLLNDKMIVSQNSHGGLLQITNYNPKGLRPTCYYFHLGSKFRRWDSKNTKWQLFELAPGNEVLTLEPNEYVLVESAERIRCSSQVMAIFGQTSSLFRKGISLKNSPAIDPNFPSSGEAGYLELGLKNELSHPARIKLGDQIGKIYFFNISDTYPINSIEGTDSEEDWGRRTKNDGPLPSSESDPVGRGYVNQS